MAIWIHLLCLLTVGKVLSVQNIRIHPGAHWTPLSRTPYSKLTPLIYRIPNVPETNLARELNFLRDTFEIEFCSSQKLPNHEFCKSLDLIAEVLRLIDTHLKGQQIHLPFSPYKSTRGLSFIGSAIEWCCDVVSKATFQKYALEQRQAEILISNYNLDYTVTTNTWFKYLRLSQIIQRALLIQ